MGKATRWLKGLFGIKNPNEKDRNFDKKHNKSSNSTADSIGLCYNPATIPPNLSPAEAAWLNSFYGETEKEQSKHAIAVAAATAAAADAAVAAAHAAAAVVRLTSHGRGTMFDGGCRERWAAVKIQSAFRGYLARKALRALKALVKLQANFRGYLVRKQATATLQSMQALIRAQAAVRSRRARNSTRTSSNNNGSRARNSMERFDETRSEHVASIHSRRLSNSIDANLMLNSVEETPKIVEIDANFRSKSRSRRTNASVDFFSDDPLYIPSPIHSKLPTRLSVINAGNFHDSDWGSAGEECRFATAHSTPRFPNFNPPPTQARSVCADGVFRQLGGCPGYMANTMSFKAKLRSQSAPKQRPEMGSKRRVSLNDLMESRNSVSGIGRSPGRAAAEEPVSFKSAVLGKFDRSLATEIQRK